MGTWKIKPLYYGSITAPKGAVTPGFDLDLTVEIPYLGFLLQKEGRNILVDTGISDKFFIDGKAWGGFPAHGGRAYVERALADAGVSPNDIETIIFTHLHNDHAASTDLFPNVRFVAQKDEWKTLLDPLPAMQVRRDYDMTLADELREVKLLLVDGDIEFTDGIKLYKTPGHTPGSQSVAVITEKGIVVLVGDHWHLYCMAFGEHTEIMDMKGNKHKITPAPPVYRGVIPSSLIYNYYDYYDSCYKIKAIATKDEPGYIIPGHEPSLLVTGI